MTDFLVCYTFLKACLEEFRTDLNRPVCILSFYLTVLIWYANE